MSIDTRLTDVMLRFAELRDQGRTPTAEDLCRDCPELVDEVRRRLRDRAGDDPHMMSTTAEVAHEPAGAYATPDIPGYEIQGVLGRGGMGLVYRARQCSLNRMVALKVVRPEAAAGRAALARFQAEAEAVARFQHPHIVQIYEIGEHLGQPYFSLEYLAGGSLARRINGTPQPALWAAATVEVLARAMQAAHQRGIVHRDLKPANILLAADGTPKVADFGLAKNLAESGQTNTGTVLGTPSYMAPEQARGLTKEMGPAVDIYALGAILYELLTGRPPFRAETPLETMNQVVTAEPAPPGRLNPGVPRDLETVCLKCLHKEPRKRYVTALELAEDLQRFQKGEPVRARPVGTAARLWKWVRRNRAASVAAVLVLGTLITASVVSTIFGIRAGQAAQRATENEDLANQRAEESRKRTVRLAVASGSRFRDAGDLNQALLWYTRAWQLDKQGDAEAEAGHRLRIGGILEQVPNLVSACFHPAGVQAAQFNADASAVLTHCRGAEVYVWDPERAELKYPPLKHDGDVRQACFSPDGRLIAVRAGGEHITVWNAADGTLAFRLSHPATPLYAAFSPDDAVLATAAEDGLVRLWNVADKQVRRTLTLSADDPPAYVAFDPTGRRLVTANRKKGAQLWDASTGRQIGSELQHNSLYGTRFETASWKRFPIFRPDGRHLATATTTSYQVYDVQDGRIIARAPTYEYEARLIYSPDGEYLGRFYGGNIIFNLMQASSLKSIVNLYHPQATIVGAIAPNGKQAVTASAGGLIHRWNLEKKQAVKDWSVRCASQVTAIEITPDARFLLAASLDGTARVWRLDSAKPEPYRFDCGGATPF